MRRILPGVVAVALLLPASAWACSVCGPGSDDVTRKAFLDSTVFLSLLPLAAMGGAAVWIWRRSLQRTAPTSAG